MRQLTTSVNLTPGSASTWVDKDLTSYITSGEICAVFKISNASPKTTETCKIRAKGATIDPPSIKLPSNGAAIYLTYLDVDDIIQIWSDQANTQFRLLGFMNESSIKKTDLGNNYIDKTSSVGTTCTSLDLTSDIDSGDDPVGAFWQSGYVSTSDPLLDHSQSTSTCANGAVLMDPMGSGLTPIDDSTDVTYLTKANSPDVWLFGFLSRDSSIARSSITPISDTGEGWQDLEDIGSTHDGAVYFFEFNKSGNVAATLGVRPNGSTDSFVASQFVQVYDSSTTTRGFFLYAEKGTSDIVEWYRPGISQDQPSSIIRLAYLEQSPSGPIAETVTEDFTVADIVIPVGGAILASISELINISDILSITGGSQSITVPETFTLDDIVSPVRMTYITLTDGSELSDQILTGFLDIVTEDITLDEETIQQIIAAPIISEDIEVSKVLSTSFPRYNTITELIELNESPIPDIIANILENINLLDLTLSGVTLNLTILDGPTLNDTVFCIYPKTILEDMSLTLVGSNQLSFNNLIQESQLLSELLTSNAVFYTESTGFFTLNDSALQIDAIIENLSVDDNQSLLANLFNTIIENEALTLIDSTNLSLYISNRDAIGINDSSLSRHFASVLVEDGAKFQIDVEFDDQEYSGWVMNPENYAVSTYSFRFTDSTLLGNNYLFSSPLGLFVFGGELDEEETIQSRIKTAALDFGSENVKQMRQAILGTDGDRWILSVSTDDDSTAQYELIAPSDGLSNKRMKIGKGLLGTRWQFELIHSREENFQLSSMEFFPVIFKRKLK